MTSFGSVKHFAKSCHVDAILVTSLCLDVQGGEVTNMKTDVVVSHLSSNGSAIYDDNSVMEGEWH